MSLQGLRAQRSWSREALARAAGLAVETVARAEAGTVRPQRVTLRKLAAALGVEPEDLYGADDEPGQARREGDR